MIEVKQFGPSGVLGNFSYIFHWDNNLLIIDPILTTNHSFITFLEDASNQGYTLFLTNTHGHADHVGNNAAILKYFPECQYIDYTQFKDGQLLFQVSQGESIDVYLTPGHYPDHVSFRVKTSKDEVWILGDTIFHGGVGNCRSGNPHTLYQTVERLKKIVSSDAQLYFAHNYASTNLAFIRSLGKVIEEDTRNLLKECEHDYITTMWRDELRYNPFLSCKSENEFVSLRQLRDRF